MQIYHDQDANLDILKGKQIGVIGFGNQGRSQALNLRDSGCRVLIGNQADRYADQARADGFRVLPISEATLQSDVVMLLIPDEVMEDLYPMQIAPFLKNGVGLVFASGYPVTFTQLVLSPHIDVVLLAPRMIGAGVRDLYLSGQGFPAFIGVAQDYSGQAKELVLALAKGIGSTRGGVVEVTFRQEAELDLFTEQCFGPAFGQVLMGAVNLLIDEGYPPEAVLLELYMSGEFSYTLAKIAELGMIEQTQLHSHTSQYGSITRGMRFLLPELRQKMLEGLDEIRSGSFAREWVAEQQAGYPTLKSLQETARLLPLYRLESELRAALHHESYQARQPINPRSGISNWLRRLSKSPRQPVYSGAQLKAAKPIDTPATEAVTIPAPLDETHLRQVLPVFLESLVNDPALLAFARGRRFSSVYFLKDLEMEFFIAFEDGQVLAGLGEPPLPAQVRLETDALTIDGMFSGRSDAARAALSGKITFSGDAKLALSMQRIQNDLRRLYQLAAMR